MKVAIVDGAVVEFVRIIDQMFSQRQFSIDEVCRLVRDEVGEELDLDSGVGEKVHGWRPFRHGEVLDEEPI